MDIIRTSLSENLAKHKLSNNKFFVDILNKTDPKIITKRFMHFYFAVENWVIHLKALNQKLSDLVNTECPTKYSKVNLDLLNDNINDELGLVEGTNTFDEQHKHTNTYKQFIYALGWNTSEQLTTHPAVVKFNNALSAHLKNKSVAYNLAVLGAIEYYYIFVSKFIIEHITPLLTAEQVHYENHEEIDIKHSDDAFTLAVQIGSSLTLMDKFSHNVDVEFGIQEGYKMLSQIYKDLAEIYN